MKIFARDLFGFAYAAAWMGIVMSFALPLAAAGALITLSSVCFLFWYVVFSVAWWTLRDFTRRIWRALSLPMPSRRSSRCESHEMFQYLDLRVVTPPNFLQDTSTDNMHATLKKTDSLQSFVGTGLDRDFEGLGGWASAQDDDALWMAKPWDYEEYSGPHQLTRRSLSPSTRRSSMSIAPEMRTPSRLPEGISRSDAYFPSPLVAPVPRSRRQSMHRRNNLSTNSFSTIKDEAA